MDERIPHHFMEHAGDFLGVDYPSLYVCKSKRGIKREDGGKDAYKLPHRLIEKKRRDRINECIGQLKDLLPEHLKVSTLGHLEKAVVLELTLKHLNALTAVTEQQHQKIVALQTGDRPMKTSIQADLDAFHSGFQACAKEVLQYLSQFENWTAREQRCAQLVGHLHKALAQFQLQLQHQDQDQHRHQLGDAQDGHKADGQANCVPVIQRTQGGELNEHDTDTDSGYGGEAEKHDGGEAGRERGKAPGHKAVKVKQEFGDDRAAKKTKMNWPGTGLGGADPVRPDLALVNSLMGISGLGPQAPLCLPFYVINPSAAASYMPFFDKSNLEKFAYPAAIASPFPWLYPAHAHASAAAAAAFPGLAARAGSSPRSSGSRSPDSDESREADAASPEQREDESRDADDAFRESDPRDQFPVAQTS